MHTLRAMICIATLVGNLLRELMRSEPEWTVKTALTLLPYLGLNVVNVFQTNGAVHDRWVS